MTARLARVAARLLAVWLFALAARCAFADAGWFESGDTLLRADLQLLNDAEVIRYPLNQWPVPRAGVEYALSRAHENFATNAAVMAALARVRARVGAAPAGVSLDAHVIAGQDGLWRDFDTLGRE